MRESELGKRGVPPPFPHLNFRVREILSPSPIGRSSTFKPRYCFSGWVIFFKEAWTHRQRAETVAFQDPRQPASMGSSPLVATPSDFNHELRRVAPAESHCHMDCKYAALVDRLRGGEPAKFPPETSTAAFAQALDTQDPLRSLRDDFIIPTKASLKKQALDGSIPGMCLPTDMFQDFLTFIVDSSLPSRVQPGVLIVLK